MSQVLIIDDDDDIRLMVALMLAGTGYAVAEAENGAAGLAHLAAHPADCVLLDVNMSGLSGWEVCRRIKANPATAHIPVIIQTVRSAIRDTDELASARPDGFLNKPFGKPELLAAIDAVLATRAT